MDQADASTPDLDNHSGRSLRTDLLWAWRNVLHAGRKRQGLLVLGLMLLGGFPELIDARRSRSAACAVREHGGSPLDQPRERAPVALRNQSGGLFSCDDFDHFLQRCCRHRHRSNSARLGKSEICLRDPLRCRRRALRPHAAPAVYIPCGCQQQSHHQQPGERPKTCDGHADAHAARGHCRRHRYLRPWWPDNPQPVRFSRRNFRIWADLRRFVTDSRTRD